MDSKASTAGKGCKEDHSVVGYCGYSFPYFLSTALGSRHSRNSSPSLSLLFLHLRSFCLWPPTHSFSDFSTLGSLDLLLPETVLRWVPWHAWAGTEAHHKLLLVLSSAWTKGSAKSTRLGTITWAPISSWTNVRENKLWANNLNDELETNVNVLKVSFLCEEHRW